MEVLTCCEPESDIIHTWERNRKLTAASVTESAGKIHNFSFSDDQISSALMFDLCKCLVCKDLQSVMSAA